jgi:hypothetical protein
MVLALGSTITISDEKMAGYMFGNNPNARLCRCDRDFGATQLFLAVRIE